MTIMGIINGFANPENVAEHVILFGRGSGYSLVVDGIQRGEQEPTLDAGLSALAKLCEDKFGTWREVRGTSTSSLGHTVVTELGSSVMGDFDLRP